MKKWVIFLVALALAFVAGCWVGSRQSRDVRDLATGTTKVRLPQAAKTEPVGIVTVPVKVVTKEPDDVEIPEGTILVYEPFLRDSPDSTDSFDSLYSDTLRAVVPIEQKEYRDSNYRAYVSGFHASLDSIEVYNKTYTKTVTKYHRFNVGLTGGYGYGFVSKRLEPFIGVGVTINLFE